MRESIVLLFISLLFASCTTTPKINEPKWFALSERFVSTENEYFGYGEGKTLKEAKARAAESIALTLNSSVESLTLLKSDDLGSSSNSQLKVSTKLNLQNIKIIQQEQINEHFFVVLSYKNIDLLSRVQERLDVSKLQNEKQNSYLSQTPLLKKLNKGLGVTLNFSLHRQNETWYFKYDKELFPLNEREFEKLFVTLQSDDVVLESSKKVLKDGDEFYFRIEAQKEGYVALLNVYENGVVTLLKPSSKIQKKLQIPSEESSNYFEAGVLQEGSDTYDLYLLLYSKEPLDLSRFEYGDETLAQSEMAYKFDELTRLLEQYSYTTLFLRTKAWSKNDNTF